MLSRFVVYRPRNISDNLTNHCFSQAFGWQTFKRIGADLQINRIYKLVLIHSISLQLSIFFIVVSMALWIDQLYNGAIGRDTPHAGLFKVVYIVLYLVRTPILNVPAASG